MVTGAAPGSERIFMSYRRQDAAYPAGWLFDRLSDHFGHGQIFKDIDSIELGDDFVEAITLAVGSCDVLLALIGDEWLTVTDEHGRRRLDDPDDFVRVEIEAALARQVLVIPVLVGAARMPSATDLPPSLAPLSRRQALELSPNRFDADTSRLLRVLDRSLAETRPGAHPEPSTTPAPATHSEPTTSPPSATSPPSDSRPGVDAPPAATGPAAGAGSATPAASAASAGRTGWRRAFTRRRVLLGAGIIVLAIVLLSVLGDPGGSSGDASTNGTTRSPSSGTTVFGDDFSNHAGGWNGGEYVNGTLRITARGTTQPAAPEQSSSLFPSAPTNLSVAVDGRGISGSADLQYGLACRVNTDEGAGYYFLVTKELIAIVHYNPARPDDNPLAQVQVSSLDPMANNHLRATCTTDGKNGSVHLTFTVNGQTITATDTANPYLTGTVALIGAPPVNEPKSTIVVEFDNFAVTR
ncbi:MAG: toll/interleukin-1 receptor domain-containing protein [Frankia sp.]